jgi:hypothetical protein
MSGPTEVVIAGTKPFALALFAPVTERAGSRPRIAPEPAAALTLCVQSTDLLVVEYEPRWLPALTKLRLDRPSLRVVAALPRGQEGAALALGPLSIDAVPWDGQAVSVMPAIARALDGVRSPPTTSPVEVAVPRAADRQAPTAAAPAPAAVPAAAVDVATQAASPAAPGATLDLFQDLGATAATPYPASLAAVGSLPLPLPSRTGTAWPATGPSAAEAELALRALLAGRPDTSPLRAVIEQTVAGLSGLERDVFSGAVPVDAELIRHAAVLRLRAAAALATRPPPGTPIDSAAIAELLSEIDGVLHQVKALLDGATPEVKPQLEAIRNALVKEAVDFSEACHEIGTAELPLVPAPARITGRAAAARVLSSRAGLDTEDRPEERRRRVLPLVILAVVLASGAAYHASTIYLAPPKQQPTTFEGAPAGTMAVQNGNAYFLVALPGKKVSGAELEGFKQREARRGNRVREVGPGTWIIEPAPAGGRGTP